MSGPDAPQRYDTIVVVGGGCYGSYYVRQLERAAKAGAITADHVVVVDRDASCAVAKTLASDAGERVLPVEVAPAEWRAFFTEYLGDAAREPERHAGDAIVPSPLMPHLMAEWLVDQTRERFAGRTIATRPLDNVPDVPWSRAGDDGTHYVSFATWMCPVNCIEPRICPHTRDVRTWSMPEAVVDHAKQETADDRPILAATLFCRHRAYGVGMFDTAEVTDARERIFRVADNGAAEILIGTVSHCHGALTRLVIGPPARKADSPVP